MTDSKDVITGWVDYIVDNLCHKIDEVNEYKEYYVWFTAKGWHASTDNPYPSAHGSSVEQYHPRMQKIKP